MEYRIAAADINPYLAIAVALGSGLYGIEHRIEPDAMVEGNAYEQTFPKERSLPRTLTEAMAAGGAEAKRAFDAMMKMQKIDVAAIDAARRG